MTKQIKHTATLALNKVCEVYGLSPEIEIGLTWADDDYIQKLNFDYRGKNTPTDVLAFAMNDEPADGVPKILNQPQNQNIEILLGDIVVSLETAVRQADEYGHSLSREIAFLVIHGALHLLGYDHMEEVEQQEMRQEEEHVLSLLKITRDM